MIVTVSSPSQELDLSPEFVGANSSHESEAMDGGGAGIPRGEMRQRRERSPQAPAHYYYTMSHMFLYTL